MAATSSSASLVASLRMAHLLPRGHHHHTQTHTHIRRCSCLASARTVSSVAFHAAGQSSVLEVELTSRRARLPASIGYQLEGNDAHRVDSRCSSRETVRLRHDVICLNSPSTTPASTADSAGHFLACPSSEVAVRHSFLAFSSLCKTGGHAAGHRAAGRSRCGISAETCGLAALCRAARDMAFGGARDTTPSSLFSWQSCSGG